MSAQNYDVIQLEIDISKPKSSPYPPYSYNVVDRIKGTRPTVYSATDIQVNVFLWNSVTGQPVDLSQMTSLGLIISAQGGLLSAPYVNLTQASIDLTTTVQTWQQGLQQHAVFTISASSLDIPFSVAQTQTLSVQISGVSVQGTQIVFASFPLPAILNVKGMGAAAPSAPNFLPTATALGLYPAMIGPGPASASGPVSLGNNCPAFNLGQAVWFQIRVPNGPMAGQLVWVAGWQ
jgi:hypothetical protein